MINRVVRRITKEIESNGVFNSDETCKKASFEVYFNNENGMMYFPSIDECFDKNGNPSSKQTSVTEDFRAKIKSFKKTQTSSSTKSSKDEDMEDVSESENEDEPKIKKSSPLKPSKNLLAGLKKKTQPKDNSDSESTPSTKRKISKKSSNDDEDNQKKIKRKLSQRNDPFRSICGISVYDEKEAKSLFEEDKSTGTSKSLVTPKDAQNFYESFKEWNYKIPVYFNQKQSYTVNGELIEQYCIVKYNNPESSIISIEFEIGGEPIGNGADALSRIQALDGSLDGVKEASRSKSSKSHAWSKFFVYILNDEKNTTKFYKLKDIIPYAFRKQKTGKKGKKTDESKDEDKKVDSPVTTTTKSTDDKVEQEVEEEKPVAEDDGNF